MPPAELVDGTSYPAAKAERLPLVFKALGCEALPRGARVRVRITGTDAMTLDVHASLVARLDAPAAAPPQADDVEDEDEVQAAAPLALAIDVDDAGTAETPLPTPA